MSRKADALQVKVFEGMYKNLICNFWNKSDITFTDVWDSRVESYQLSEDELLTGELSAATYTVGCYTIRSAQRVYVKPEHNHGNNLVDEIPADEEYLNKLKQNARNKNSNDTSIVGMHIGFESIFENNRRIAHGISARHIYDPNNLFAKGFKYICRATRAWGYSWSESIQHIVTVKEQSQPDECASLFVCNQYVGSSFSVDTWYQLSPNGRISEFRIHPYDESK